ncbi:MAG: alpha/beta hydrolase [Sphingomonas sp.]
MDLDSSADRPLPVLIVARGDPAIALPLQRVELDLTKFHSGRWAQQLDTAMTRSREPVVLLAQGVACLAVAWWAQLSPRSYLEHIRGAVFLSPLSIGFGQAAIAAKARVSPATKLPFPSVVASDPSSMIEQVLALADNWGSRFVDSGAVQGAHPSNRRGGGTAAEDRLLHLLGLFDTPEAAGTGKTLEAAITSRIESIR